jgi:hypothetical protein
MALLYHEVERTGVLGEVAVRPGALNVRRQAWVVLAVVIDPCRCPAPLEDSAVPHCGMADLRCVAWCRCPPKAVLLGGKLTLASAFSVLKGRNVGSAMPRNERMPSVRHINPSLPLPSHQKGVLEISCCCSSAHLGSMSNSDRSLYMGD